MSGIVTSLGSELSAVSNPGSRQTIINIIGNPIVVESGGGGLPVNFDQTTPSNVWTVAHNLGRKPPVTVTDHLGNQIFADVVYVDNNIIRITHGSAITGSVYCK